MINIALDNTVKSINMKYIKKEGKEICKVKNPNAFKGMEEIMNDLVSDAIFHFMQSCAANTAIEKSYENWLTKHYRDDAFNIVKDKKGRLFAVAYENDIKAKYAVEIEFVETE